MDVTKPQLVVSFVERGARKSNPPPRSLKVGSLIAIAAPGGGKRLLRLGRSHLQSQQTTPRLIGVLTERNAPNDKKTRNEANFLKEKSEDEGKKEEDESEREDRLERLPVKVDSRQALTLAALGLEQRRVVIDVGRNSDGCGGEVGGVGGGCGVGVGGLGERKIPRPANAFMLFANEWRKRLASENPSESNKDISVRLGILWKTISKDEKERYFELARQVDAEHKRKYPDYVYNPKEARLRKAMREQSRTTPTNPQQQQQQQGHNSLSSSRAQNLQANCGAAANAAATPHEAQQQQQQQPVSPLPGPNRIIGPWFPLGGAAALPPTHHQQQQQQPAKPILSPRVSVSTHQQHRSLDKTKEAIRRQLESCGMQAASGMQPFSGHEPSGGGDFCGPLGGFGDAHKWHPYQNGMSAYHARSSLMSKMSNLQRGMQSAACHAAASAWGQFCNVPFYSSSQSAAMRNNRHAVFLAEQQQQQQQNQQQYQQHQLNSQHCGYQDLQQLQSYEAKLHDDLARRLSSSYPQTEQQAKSPTPSRTASSREDSASEDGPRWCNEPRPSSVCSSSCTTDGEQPPTQSQPQQPPRSTKPLPGFQQAFGSTEIGRFSRSELFASLIEAANNLIPCNGLPESSTVHSYTSSIDPLSKLRRKHWMERLKAQKSQWTRGVDIPDSKHKLVMSSLRSRKVSSNCIFGSPLPAHGQQNYPKLRPTEECEALDLRVAARKLDEAEQTVAPDSSVES